MDERRAWRRNASKYMDGNLEFLHFSSTLTILEVIIGVMAGYVLARIEFPGRQALMKTTLLLHAFPSVALLIAVYYILNFMGLFDSLWGLFW